METELQSQVTAPPELQTPFSSHGFVTSFLSKAAVKNVQSAFVLSAKSEFFHWGFKW